MVDRGVLNWESASQVETGEAGSCRGKWSAFGISGPQRVGARCKWRADRTSNAETISLTSICIIRSVQKVDFREEVVNVALAELLERRGMLPVPEAIRRSITRNTRDLPDIIVADLLGIRMVIEGRFNSGRVARDSLLKVARERVEQGISPVCLAVLYPPELRSAESLPKLRGNLESATVGIRVISENRDGDWMDGTDCSRLADNAELTQRQGQACSQRSESPRFPEESLHLGTRGGGPGPLAFGKARLTDRRAGR